MERLTKRLDDGWPVMDCQRCKMANTVDCTALGCRNMVKTRLAAYEDTGLLPEEIKEDMPDVRKIEEKLAGYEDAEANGLLVRLPCKVGDTFWWIERLVGDDKPFIRSSQVSEIGISDAITIYEYDGRDFAIEDVYFTREEAEAALADDKE